MPHDTGRRRVPRGVSRPLAWLAVTMGLMTIAGAAWWALSADESVTIDAIGDTVQTRAAGALPVFATGGDTAALYRFARERGDVLQWMPCTCGCQQFGHTSNRACYITSESADSTTWTSHAAT